MKRILLTLIPFLFPIGCATVADSPPSSPKQVVIKPPVDDPCEEPRVMAGAYEAKEIKFPAYLKKSIEGLAAAATNSPVAIELHGRGRAVRVAVIGKFTKDESYGLGVALCNILRMYYDDVVVTVNNGVFKPTGRPPDDGRV